MSYLLDTNVVSEFQRRIPNPQVASWIAERPESSLHISVLTLGEIRKGIQRLTDVVKRRRIEDWLANEVPIFFSNRVLPVDLAVADCWGRLVGSSLRTLPAIDSLIAATALHHRLTLVTRNMRDFQVPGLDVVNPWQSGHNENHEP